MNQPIEQPVNDWNAQRTINMIAEALSDLFTLHELQTALAVCNFAAGQRIISVCVSTLSGVEVYYSGAVTYCDNSQEELDGIFRKVMACFPESSTTEQLF